MATIQLSDSERVESYLSWSVFNLLCCFCPLGLLALIFSCKVDIASRSDNIDSAKRYSHLARLLNLLSTIVGIVIIIIVIASRVYWS